MRGDDGLFGVGMYNYGYQVYIWSEPPDAPFQVPTPKDTSVPDRVSSKSTQNSCVVAPASLVIHPEPGKGLLSGVAVGDCPRS